jgi:HAD superfamily hydrolase (TIGR01549 family)
VANRSRKRASRAAPAAARAWLLDFDATLAHLGSAVDWGASRRELETYLRRAGPAAELFERYPRGNLLLYDAYRALAQNGAKPRERVRAAATLKRASAIIEKYELRGVEHAPPVDGAIEMLRALNGIDACVAIVTSNSSRVVKKWLAAHGAARTVAHIVGRDSLLPLKPAPDMLLRALKECASAPREAAFVGDSEADAEAARRAHVRFFGVATSAAMRDRLVTAGATRIFSSPAALAIHLNLIAAQALSGRALVTA